LTVQTAAVTALVEATSFARASYDEKMRRPTFVDHSFQRLLNPSAAGPLLDGVLLDGVLLDSVLR
jgi:hypothetical protein